MLRIGLFGVGRWGTNILNTLKAVEGVEVIVFDTRDAGYVSPTKDEVDAVIVATPGSTHAEVALPFITAGIPTYIEKPLTISMAEARKIERAAKKSGAGVFCGHLHLYNPAYQVAKGQAAKAGKVRYVLFEGMNNGPYRDDMSAMWDWASHDVYMAMDILNGKLPKSVQAWGLEVLRPRKTSLERGHGAPPKTALYDFSILKMTFPGGVEAISTTSWLMPEKRKKMTIVGEKDSVVLDDTAEKKVAVYEGMGPVVRERQGEPGEILRQEPTISYPPYDRKSPLQAELEAFIAMSKTGKKPLSDLAQGVAVVKVLSAAAKSLDLDGKRILV